MSYQNERFRSFASVTQQIVACDGSADNVVTSSPHHLTVQNLGVVPVYVKLGATATASTGGFSYILAACGAANDGTGGTVNISGYVGTVSFITGGTAANVVVSNG
jgi:hypothetical protein